MNFLQDQDHIHGVLNKLLINKKCIILFVMMKQLNFQKITKFQIK